MSKGNTFENDLLKLIFNGTAISLLADDTATTPLESLYVSLHTADPGEAGDQTTNECDYTSYAREAVARTDAGWTVTANSVSPAADIEFAASTGGADDTITHWAVGTAASGAGKILYSGTVAPHILAADGGSPPILSTATAITED